MAAQGKGPDEPGSGGVLLKSYTSTEEFVAVWSEMTALLSLVPDVTKRRELYHAMFGGGVLFPLEGARGLRIPAWAEGVGPHRPIASTDWSQDPDHFGPTFYSLRIDAEEEARMRDYRGGKLQCQETNRADDPAAARRLSAYPLDTQLLYIRIVKEHEIDVTRPPRPGDRLVFVRLDATSFVVLVRAAFARHLVVNLIA